MSSPDAHQLFARARAGDSDAFNALVAPLRPRLLALVRLRLPAGGQTEDGDDIVQQALIQALDALPTFEWRGERAFESWLIQVAKNRVRRTYDRRTATTPLPDSELAAIDAAASPVRRLRQEERFERLQEALEQLSPIHREVVMLARIEGLRITDIAERLGKTPTATSMLLLRALRALRSAFGETESLSLPDRSLAEPR